MNPSFRIAQVENLLHHYTEASRRIGMRDLAIWQALGSFYADPEDYEIVLTSTREEAFDRIVKDQWHVPTTEHFFGLDYETVDECVLQYLKDSKLVTDLTEEDNNE